MTGPVRVGARGRRTAGGRHCGRQSTRRWAGLAVLVLLVVVAAGCQVNTKIDVEGTPNGTGAVLVTVTLDEAAAKAVGDIKSDLQTSDLAAAGWQVTGPDTGTGGSTVIQASHAFATWAQASTLVAEIAGTGAAGSRPFQLEVTHHKTFWTNSSSLAGRADLRCNLDCFGDAGLRRELGVSTGIDPGSLASQRQDFTFGLSVTLPGTLKSSNAESVSGHRLSWTPRLGEDTVLSATTSDRNTTHVYGAIGVAAAVVLLVILAIVTALWRRRSRRRPRSLW